MTAQPTIGDGGEKVVSRNATSTSSDDETRVSSKDVPSSTPAAARATTDGLGATNGGATKNNGTDAPVTPASATPEPEQPHGNDGGATAPEDQRTKLQTAIIMISLCAAVFLAALDVTIVTVAIPTIAEEFNSTAGYTWIGSAYLLANAAAAPSWGKISDIWGRKPIMLTAVGVFWIGSLLAAVSVSMGMLIAARAIQGIGGGGILILVNICISDLFSMRRRGIFFGVVGMVWALAGGFGPVLGGAFTDYVTWRWCFYVNLPISGLAIVVLFFSLKLHNPRTGVKEGLVTVDWLGSLTIVGGTLMLLLGLEFGGVTYPWSSPTVICLIIFGVVVAGLFVVVEAKIATYPVMPMRLFQVWSNIAALAVCAIHGFVFVSASYYLPLYFQGVLGASPLLSGISVLPFTLTLGVASAGVGFYIKKSGKYLPPIIGGFALMVLGYGLFIDLEPTANWPKIILYQMVLGVGVGPNFQAPLIALQTTVQPRDIASATATYGFIRQLSTSISVVIGGVIFQNGMQRQSTRLMAELSPEIANLLTGSNAAASVSAVSALTGNEGRIARDAYYNALRTMYIVYTAFAAFGLFLSFFVGARTLTKEHTEFKTGLKNLQPEKKRVADEEKAAREQEAGVVEKGGPVAGRNSQETAVEGGPSGQNLNEKTTSDGDKAVN